MFSSIQFDPRVRGISIYISIYIYYIYMYIYIYLSIYNYIHIFDYLSTLYTKCRPVEMGGENVILYFSFGTLSYLDRKSYCLSWFRVDLGEI